MFLTLPSNSSMDIYPENKVSDFVVHLPRELNLTGSWEVGLAEIFYPNSWYTIDSRNFYIYYEQGKVSVRTTLAPGFYQHPKQIVEQLLQQLKNDFSKKNQTLLNSNEISKPLDFLFDLCFNDHTQLAEIHLKHEPESTGHVHPRESNQGTFVILSHPLSQLLGYTQRRITEKGVYVSNRVVDINVVSAIYVYCNVIEHRTVGHTLSPLMSVIPVEGQSGDSISKRYEKLQYHPVLKKNISDIHISLRNDQGNLIRFRKGKVIVTLHFRRCKLKQL